jgi:hypothetical protein
MRKIATNVTAIGLSLCMVTVAATARGGGGGGGAHFGGGGGGAHFGGGGGAHFGGGGGAHFGGAAHIGGGPHFVGHAAPRMAVHSAPHFAPRVSGGHPSFHTAGHGPGTPGFGRGTSFAHPGTAGRPNGFSRAGLAANPRTFAARRGFFARTAFAPFWHHGGWHPFHHLGWIGPLFWPYAYGDFFYYALWPYDYGYYDPFWVYGYGDLYEGIFSPYTYDEYVQGPGAPAKMTALTESMAQSCAEEAAEVTGWPISQIQAAVQPNPEQSAMLDDLGNAVVKASDVIKSHCPTSVSFTATGRLDAMKERLEGMVQGVDIISPPLSKFYDSLSDEQKARFNDIQPPQNPQGATPQAANAPAPQGANAPTPQSECDASVMAWPTEQIDRTVQPNDAQRAKLDALQAAAANGAAIIKASCPTEIPSTPPDRLAAVGNHLKAMLQAVQAIEPALTDFYNSLSDEQKARFNTIGKQLFAQNQE